MYGKWDIYRVFADSKIATRDLVTGKADWEETSVMPQRMAVAWAFTTDIYTTTEAVKN